MKKDEVKAQGGKEEWKGAGAPRAASDSALLPSIFDSFLRPASFLPDFALDPSPFCLQR